MSLEFVSLVLTARLLTGHRVFVRRRGLVVGRRRVVGGRGRRRGRRSTAHGAEPSLMWGRLGRGCGLLPLLAVVLLHLRAPSRGRGCAPRALRHRHHHLPLRHHHRHRSVRSRLLRPSLLRLARVLLHDRHVHHLVRPRRWVLVPRRLVSLPGRAVGCEPGALRWIHDTAPARPVEWKPPKAIYGCPIGNNNRPIDYHRHTVTPTTRCGGLRRARRCRCAYHSRASRWCGTSSRSRHGSPRASPSRRHTSPTSEI